MPRLPEAAAARCSAGVCVLQACALAQTVLDCYADFNVHRPQNSCQGVGDVDSPQCCKPRRHFAEPPAACDAGCDACAAAAEGDSTGSAATRDVSAEAQGVLAALAALPAADKRATLIQLIDRWRALKVLPCSFQLPLRLCRQCAASPSTAHFLWGLRPILARHQKLLTWNKRGSHAFLWAVWLG